jgi:hypothetical protein
MTGCPVLTLHLCVTQLCIGVTKYLMQSTYKEERFILTEVSEVSVHGLLTTLLLGLWRPNTSWRGVCGGAKQLISWHFGDRERQEGLGSQYPLLGTSPSRVQSQ